MGLPRKGTLESVMPPNGRLPFTNTPSSWCATTLENLLPQKERAPYDSFPPTSKEKGRLGGKKTLLRGHLRWPTTAILPWPS